MIYRIILQQHGYYSVLLLFILGVFVQIAIYLQFLLSQHRN